MSDKVSTREALKRVRDDDKDMEFTVVVISFIMIVVGAWYGQKYRLKEGVVGALDGTHIKMTVPIEDRPRYRDRKGDLSTNETPQATAYHNKFIENRDDICTLFASDRATDEGAEHDDQAAAAMDTEIEGVSTSETSSEG
uniref:Uncharacterized protein n=1 Tax=Chenopodium quinoa TaxID=63459 RepID=A0A803N0X2_CHEQI